MKKAESTLGKEKPHIIRIADRCEEAADFCGHNKLLRPDEGLPKRVWGENVKKERVQKIKGRHFWGQYFSQKRQNGIGRNTQLLLAQ